MTPKNRVPRLIGHLLRRGGPHRLNTPLSSVQANLGEPGASLVELGELFEVQTLGELLVAPSLERVAEQRLGEARARALFASLVQWTRGLSVSGGDSESEGRRPGVYLTPKGPSSVETWAREQGVSSHLADPARRLEPWLEARWSLEQAWRERPGLTVGDCLDQHKLPLPLKALAGSGGIHDAVRGYLTYQAEARARDQRRQKLWNKAPRTAELQLLSSSLKEARARLLDDEATERPLRYKELHLEVDPAAPALTASFGVRVQWWDRTTTARVDLAGFETRPPRLSCSCQLAGTVQGCPHLEATLSFALDAVHDEADPLHKKLAQAIEAPTWARLLEAFEIGDEAAAKPRRPRQLVWRVSTAGGRVSITPALRKQKKNGSWTLGSRVKTRELSSLIGLMDGADRVVYGHLLAADELAPIDHDDIGPSQGELARALEALSGHERVYDREAAGQQVTVTRVRPALALTPAETSGHYQLELRLGPRAVPAERAGNLLYDGELLIATGEESHQIILGRVGPSVRRLLAATAKHPTTLPPETQGRLLELLMPLQGEVDLVIPDQLRGERVEPESEPLLRLSPLPDEGLQASLVNRPLLGGASWPPGEGPAEVFSQTAGGGRVSTSRDLDAERASAAELCAALGLDEATAASPFQWSLVTPEAALDLIAAARERGPTLIVEWPEDNPWQITKATRGQLRVRVNERADWLGVEGEVELEGGGKVPLRVLLEAARRGRRYLRLGPGRFAKLADDLVEVLGKAEESLHELGSSKLVAGHGAAKALSKAFKDIGRLEADLAFTDLLARIEAAESLEPTVPAELEATLRPYQASGFRWLSRLSAWDAGCLLADDMGLGKTVQTLALLLTRRDQGPSLVVAPTSVGSVWLEQAAIFAPVLRPRLYRGPKRGKLLEGLGPGDLLITSYDILALDADKLADLELDAVIFDEAQAIKNARTRRARAAYRLKARFRLALSGTPVENHLGELWSLFRAINPGLLGPWERFRSSWAMPIEREGDKARRDQLAKKLRPFILRRTKAQVAPELPPRTEVVRPVELSSRERRAYDGARREILEGAIAESATEKDRFALLAGITRLRRLACHPRLVDDTSSLPSAKLEATLELVEQLLAEGQRALIFSQFTGHLALLRAELERRSLDYLSLDGSTTERKRAALVKRWASGEDQLFLISLKAGGTGLTLTGADLVLHLDPWWNPAVEDQATDRTHRIGQDRPVTVVRLIAQGTIEEAVLSLHAKKRELAMGLLDGADASAKVEAEELVELIRYGAG